MTSSPNDYIYIVVGCHFVNYYINLQLNRFCVVERERAISMPAVLSASVTKLALAAHFALFMFR